MSTIKVRLSEGRTFRLQRTSGAGDTSSRASYTDSQQRSAERLQTLLGSHPVLPSASSHDRAVHRRSTRFLQHLRQFAERRSGSHHVVNNNDPRTRKRNHWPRLESVLHVCESFRTCQRSLLFRQPVTANQTLAHWHSGDCMNAFGNHCCGMKPALESALPMDRNGRQNIGVVKEFVLHQPQAKQPPELKS